jgi:hypothetical protein
LDDLKSALTKHRAPTGGHEIRELLNGFVMDHIFPILHVLKVSSMRAHTGEDDGAGVGSAPA